MKLLELEATADNLDPVKLIAESLDVHVGAVHLHLVAKDVVLGEFRMADS